MLPKPFKNAIARAQADDNLQSALDGNAERRIHARLTAFPDEEDYQARRQQSHAIRADVIGNLDSYLEMFTSRLQANGIKVHLAQDGKQAVQIILDIARLHKAQLIAKSKTMISEEIDLNPALEAAGIQVVETDLGEYIVQLRHERPAHIITPAVHLRRADVARLFEEKLGLPYTENIPDLTSAARHALRRVFLTAAIGLSGVNFGVAETGALCVFTNEGNGRMVTTRPPVHIALMGMERLVPDMESLALMLSLLPRSATGQKMTVYGSLVNAPRRPGDADGPQERHVILLDNGRSALRRSPLAEVLYCIRCGACLNACPAFRELGGHAYVGATGKSTAYPGPIGSVLSPALFGQAEFANLAHACSLCGACGEACPVRIDLPELLLRVRAGGMHIQQHAIPPGVARPLAVGLGLFRWMAVSPLRFAWAQRLAGWGSGLLAIRRGWIRLPAWTGWGYSKDFPCPARRSFKQRFIRLEQNLAERSVDNHGFTSALVNQAVSTPGGFLPLNVTNDNLADQFAAELAALGGQCFTCREAELPEQIAGQLRQRGIDRIATWQAPGLPQALLDALMRMGFELLPCAEPDTRAGLTGALAGAAKTATLAIPGGPGCPLETSLLPEVHLAAMPIEALYPSLVDVLTLPQAQQASALALVSGPSRTADIEMTLTIGVHGPKEVLVFLYQAG